MLAQRVATAAIGIPLLLLLILLGDWPYAIFVALALGVATVEFGHLRYPWISVKTVLPALTVTAVVLLVLPIGGGIAAVFAAAAVLQLAIRIVIARFRDGERSEAALWMTLALYTGVLGSTFVLLRDLDNGRDWVLLALAGTFAADTFAYFTGRALGRHRMAPTISPNKTWEGFAGGWLGSIAVMLSANWLLGLRVEAAIIVPLALLLPIAATLGDLFESWLKRRAGVKDASNLIPGHGGVLDRIDSLLFTVPLVWLFARWLA